MIESNIYLEMILHTNLDLTSIRRKSSLISQNIEFLLPLELINIKKQGDVIPLPD